MISERLVRDMANFIVVYGIPIIIVILMIVIVNIYSPLMNAAPPALPEPIIRYYKYSILDNNSTIILYFNTENTEFIGIHNISIIVGDEKVEPLKTSFKGDELYIITEPYVLKEACIRGDYIDISFTGLVRYLNSTAIFRSYGIRLVYHCRIIINVEDRGTYINVTVRGPSWIADEGLDLNISVRLYGSTSTGTIKLVENTDLTVTYHDLPIIIPVREHSFGYVFITYMRGGKTVREGFYVEPEK